MFLTYLRNSPSAKSYIINTIVVLLFALVIIGIVLGTVLSKTSHTTQAANKDTESSSYTSCVECTSSNVGYSKPTDVSSSEFASSELKTTNTNGTGDDNGVGSQQTPTEDVNENISDLYGDDMPAYTTTPMDGSSSVSKRSTITKTVVVIKHKSTISAYVMPVNAVSTDTSVHSSALNGHSNDNSGNSVSDSVGSSSNVQTTDSDSGNGLLWGLNYSPYNTDGSCPDVNTVAGQLAKVASVTKNIRLYSTDCSQFENALQAITSNNLGLSIHAGIWISDGQTRMQSDLDQFVSAAKKFGTGLIKGVSVGNEDISKGMSESTLIGYINQVRSRLQAEGLGNIPVYTTEQDALFSSPMAAASDTVMVNIHAIFDSQFYSIDASVQSVIQRATNVKNNVAGGKPVVISETGWSSAGNTGPCPLTLANEIAYAQKFKCAAKTAGYSYFYFEAKNANWKQGAVASEQNFGIFDAGFTPKFDFNLLNVC